MDGFSFLCSHHHCIFGNFVIPQAKVLWDGKCSTAVVGQVGRPELNSSYNMMNAICPVVRDGLEIIEDLFLQGKEVITVWLANDRWLIV